MEQAREKRSPWKPLLIGCGAITVIVLGLFAWGIVWLASTPESGVKLANEMDAYALEYLDEHRILEPGEELLAYFDATIRMDGSEAAILTSERVIYHKARNTIAIRLEDVRDVQHRYEGFIGDVFEVYSGSGRTMKIEIPPLNQGETFKNVLMTAWQRVRERAANDPT
jgi:hypothetical protein